MIKKIIKNQDEMAKLAKKMAQIVQIGDVVTLKGTLGAGKSFFARNFINSLSEKPQEVLSPTFNLVYSYETEKGEISHFDLYRLKNAHELENIGFFDALRNGICLIEWPEIAEKYLKKNYFEIAISFDGKLQNDSEENEVRIVEIKTDKEDLYKSPYFE